MIVDDFLAYLRAEKNYSLLTQQSYGEDLVAFEKFFQQLDSTLQWETIDADIVRDWMEEMMDKGNTATTINRPALCYERSGTQYYRSQEGKATAAVRQRVGDGQAAG